MFLSTLAGLEPRWITVVGANLLPFPVAVPQVLTDKNRFPLGGDAHEHLLRHRDDSLGPSPSEHLTRPDGRRALGVGGS
jgi:hypothetical protein